MRIRCLSLGLCLVLFGCGHTTGVALKPLSTSNGVTTITQTDLKPLSLPAITAHAGSQATDWHGATVVVKDVSRIVSVATSCAEIISALGLTKNLVGRDIASKSSALEGVPVVTDAMSVNAEKVLATHPTLIIIDKQTGPTSALASIAASGIQIVQVPSAWTLSDLMPRITAVASVLGVSQQASVLEQLMVVSPHAQTSTKVAFLYLRGNSSIYLLGGVGSGADALITAAGAHDVGASAALAAFTPLTPEALPRLKPDVILVMTNGLASVGGVTGLLAIPGIAQTPAGRNRHIVAVDDGLLLAFGADAYALIDRLAEAFTVRGSA